MDDVKPEPSTHQSNGGADQEGLEDVSDDKLSARSQNIQSRSPASDEQEVLLDKIDESLVDEEASALTNGNQQYKIEEQPQVSSLDNGVHVPPEVKISPEVEVSGDNKMDTATPTASEELTRVIFFVIGKSLLIYTYFDTYFVNK